MSFLQQLLRMLFGQARRPAQVPAAPPRAEPEPMPQSAPANHDKPMRAERPPQTSTPRQPQHVALGKQAAGIICLGCVDANVPESAWTVFVDALKRMTRVSLSDVKDGLDRVEQIRLEPQPETVMTVFDLQQALKTLGFFPGGEVDGICGYRTQSALRLFQEYVRTMDAKPCLPDGRFGPQTNDHLQRWLSKKKRPDWQQRPREYDYWLDLLNAIKGKYAQTPGRVLGKVNAYEGESDTRKVSEWDFSPDHIHLISVRRRQFDGKFDDIFVLLIKGLVFKFQGSTEPGASSHALGPPYIVPGQHDYHFGWHRKTYLAMRPLGRGVLIIRAGKDGKFDASDLGRDLEANASINIHWGGSGMARDINSWSEGCQVINGTLYLNPKGDLVDCSRFAAVFSKDPTRLPSKTRGAYSLLTDLVTALSGDMASNTVKYTMISEDDLALSPHIQQDLDTAREKVMALTSYRAGR